jgi:hypothetical protein
MAPEEGLEPSTSRLTAACSTIELLWNAKGHGIYQPDFPRQEFASIRDERPDLFAHHDAAEIVWLVEIKNDDRHFVVHAQRERR